MSSEPSIPVTSGASIAVVTGASSGIGRATALALAAAGHSVVVHARSNQAGANEVAELVKQRGVDATVILCDLSDASTHASLVEQAWNWRGAVDIWVNNAGVDVLTGPAAGWPFEKKLQELFRVDVAATMALARDAGRRMQDRGAGSIVNIGWDQAEFGMGGDSGELFAAIKGAVMAFTKSLASSLAPQVRVNCIAPGWIKTKWGENAPPDWQHRAVHESLLGRWGTPEDVAAAICFLASPAAGFINAQTLAVNGGFKHS
jgi:3-oxoacyl-[acyl-carrier protein] reductase